MVKGSGSLRLLLKRQPELGYLNEILGVRFFNGVKDLTLAGYRDVILCPAQPLQKNGFIAPKFVDTQFGEP